jgi:phosphotransferase system HPr-like phosphotransfer protein
VIVISAQGPEAAAAVHALADLVADRFEEDR